ncbi:MAG: HD domain-containing protein, partial [Tissierellia bacterium]|nr:HD domain-containing protein [Tissierellia bacterium]
YYLVIYQAVRLVGLLHDIGHPPFSHITEGALNKLYKSIKSKEHLTKREEKFIGILEKYYVSDIQLHENIGNQMVKWIFRTYMRENYKEEFKEKKFYALVFNAVECILLEENNTWESLHRIIDNSIDSDRLDYVSRDLLNSGINQGTIEYSRLIPSMKILLKEDIFVLSADLKTLGTIEDFFTKRWYLYNNIIFHHRVIKTDSLLEECIIGIAEDYLLREDDEVQNNSTSTLPYNISGLWHALDTTEGSDLKKFDLLIQWNDSWLMTILKKHYFDEYQTLENSKSEEKNSEKLLLRNKLEELLANKKYFHSMVKTYSEIEYLDSCILYRLKTKYITEDDIIKHITENSFLEQEDSLWESIKDKAENNLFLTKIDSYLKVVNGIDVMSKVLEWTKKFFENKKNEDQIRDYMLKTKRVKPGVSPEPVLYKDGITIKLSEVSKIEDNILRNITMFPFMNIYIDSNNNNIDKKDILKELGNFLADKIDDTFLNNKGDYYEQESANRQ